LTKLVDILRALDSRDDVAVLEHTHIINLLDVTDETRIRDLQNSEGETVIHRVVLPVVPLRGMYEAGQLQRLMLDILGGLNYRSKEDFTEFKNHGEHYIRLGSALFGENFTSRQVADGYRFFSGQRDHIPKGNYVRMIWLDIYPDESVARAIQTGQLQTARPDSRIFSKVGIEKHRQLNNPVPQ